MANTSFAFMDRPRIATHKRTGEVFFVTYFDISRNVVHTAGHVLAYSGTKVKKFATFRQFRRDEVELRDITVEPEVLHVLLEQTRETPEMKKLLMDGEMKFQARRDKTEGKIAKTPKSERVHGVHQCPVHGVPMRLRRLPDGGEFFGCGSFHETRCHVTWSERDGWKHVPEIIDQAAE